MRGEYKVQKLLAKYAAGKCTAEEKIIVESWYIKNQPLEPDDFPENERLEDMAELYAKLSKKVGTTKKKSRWRPLAAASILFVIFISGYLVFHLSSSPNKLLTDIKKSDIEPGRSQAMLTLANGMRIRLSKGLSGQLAWQGRTSIRVNEGNSITYTVFGDHQATENLVEYNTLTTVCGEESPYPLILADGTKVWLNAASSITFPTIFNGKKRHVKMTGEAYFEVAHRNNQPFYVFVNGETVQDLGTRFNINAYPDEPSVKTTLLEGRIKVSTETTVALLRPGQQSVLSSDNLLETKNADLEKAIAWKNNSFVFTDDNIEEIMRQLSRWYNAEIVYHTSTKGKNFVGTVSRFETASEVLRKLEYTDIVHFKIEGRRIIVMP